MQSHADELHERSFMERLRERADTMTANHQSQITAGKEGEESLAEWKAKGVFCRHMPDDEQGILRISVGGCGEGAPIEMNYCTIRGGVGACIQLLEKAIRALKQAP